MIHLNLEVSALYRLNHHCILNSIAPATLRPRRAGVESRPLRRRVTAPPGRATVPSDRFLPVSLAPLRRGYFLCARKQQNHSRCSRSIRLPNPKSNAANSSPVRSTFASSGRHAVDFCPIPINQVPSFASQSRQLFPTFVFVRPQRFARPSAWTKSISEAFSARR